jgi:hypothetical protein
MSQYNAEHSVPPAESIEDFANLYPRPVGINRFAVLSLADDSFTAYECDISEMTCECADARFRRDEGQICKHLAAALHDSPKVRDWNDALLRSLGNDMQELFSRFDELERKLTGVQADVDHVAANGDSEPDSDTTDSFDGDPVEYFKSLLRDEGLDPADFRIWRHDEFDSLQVEQTGYLDDPVFDDWVEFKDKLGMQYDGDDDVNFLPADKWAEVFG